MVRQIFVGILLFFCVIIPIKGDDNKENEKLYTASDLDSCQLILNGDIDRLDFKLEIYQIASFDFDGLRLL